MKQKKYYSDNQLFALLSEGCEQSYHEIYNRYWKKIYSFGINYLRQPDLSRDIVQETFLRLWLKREGLKEVKNPEDYIFIIARNLYISALRKKFPLPLTELDESTQVYDKYHEPDRHLELKEMQEMIRHAISGLSSKQQQVYLLSSEQGLSLKEIAIQLNLSYSTVREYKSDATQCIRRFLKAHAYHPYQLFILFFFIS